VAMLLEASRIAAARGGGANAAGRSAPESCAGRSRAGRRWAARDASSSPPRSSTGLSSGASAGNRARASRPRGAWIKAAVTTPARHAGGGREHLPIEVLRQLRGRPARRPAPDPLRPLAQSARVEDHGAPRAFFKARPVHLLPAPARLLSAFPRPTGRTLTSPTPASAGCARRRFDTR
jgi:hypothetical protein